MWFKRSIIFAVICLCSWAEARVYLWPVIAKARGERSEDQNLEIRSNAYPSLGVSYTWDCWQISLEHNRFENSDDSGNVSIETRYQDVSLWGGYSLFSGDIWDLYAVVGTGVYHQKVKTSVNNLSASNKSSDRSLLGGGAEILVQTPYYVSVAAGARLHWTEDLEPELMPEVYLKLGVGF